MPQLDPITVRATADALVQRAADQLREQLRQLATQIDPFPPFPGAVFAYGFEVDPPLAGDPAYGCIILGNDGALYELRIGIEATAAPGSDTPSERHEELVPAELPPALYIAYAHRAIEIAATYLGGQQDA